MESQARESALGIETPNRRWLSAVGAGLVGGVGFGLVMQFVMGAMPVVGSLYGQPTVLAGWVAHLVHSVVFAVVFVALITGTGLGRYARTTAGTTGLGTVYGAVLGVVAGAFVLPVWANAVTAAGMPVPFLSAASFLGHVLFGVLLGAAYAVIRGTRRSEPTTDTDQVQPETADPDA
jgi:uncharacterized membrane protein YagU involved in acid resistance